MESTVYVDMSFFLLLLSMNDSYNPKEGICYDEDTVSICSNYP